MANLKPIFSNNPNAPKPEGKKEWESLSDTTHEVSAECEEIVDSQSGETEEYVPWIFEFEPVDKEPSFSSDIPPTREQTQKIRNMGKNKQ